MSKEAQRAANTEDKLALIKNLEAKARMHECLPHLYGWKWYPWAWDFFNSRNHYNFLVAANQISKSTTQIRKAIHWATCPELWDSLWPSKPTQFWYFYPDKNLCTIEFEEKWLKEVLPRDEFKDHPQYGWTSQYAQKRIYSIRFNTGVSIYFRSYEQAYASQQAATVFAMFCDEELPADLFPELNARMIASRGYFHMVFTATLGQEYWRRTMEGKGGDELFPDAFKRNVSMYDCLKYMDGSQSPWTIERIKKIEVTCRDQYEIDRRVKGHFVVDRNRMYDGFIRNLNVLESHFLPKDWLIYSGVDIGSGGKGHPSAIVFVGVHPKFTEARVFKSWRGDNVKTTAGDVVRKYKELRGDMKVVGEYYDYSSADFGMIANRMGLSFQKAEKKRDKGEQMLNVLFKTRMLCLYDDPETLKMAIELENLKANQSKQGAKDDLIDALRYACAYIPWDFSVLSRKQTKVLDPYAELDERQKLYQMQKDGVVNDGGIEHLYDEFQEANENYGNDGFDYDFY